MLKFGKFISKNYILIFIISLLLLIPSVFGMIKTRVNYDMLYYLPDNLETVQGQDILMGDFGKGAFSYIVVEGMDDKQVSELREKISQVDNVSDALWYDSIFDLTVPVEMLPQDFYNAFNSGDATLIAVFFSSTSSSDETMQAITDIRNIVDKQCYVSGISALVVDLKNLCEREEPIYVTIAVCCALVAMMLLTDSWIVPLVFLACIGITILYNMGTNYFLGEISYITKALAAVLQLAVTMDYSIFLWHSYQEEREKFEDKKEAMAYAIKDTFVSVAGSSLTTIAGFVALCFMSYTMGKDLGIVMAKGVLLGVIGCITILPTLILLLDKPLQKTKHKPLIPNLEKPSRWLTNKSLACLILCVVLLVPAIFGYANKPIFYDFTKIFNESESESIDEEDIQSLVADSKLKEYFDISTTHMILCDSKMSANDAQNMLEELGNVDGVQYALGFNSLVGTSIPEDAVPEDLKAMLKSENWQLILINSTYQISTDECNNQLDELSSILKKYDENGMLIGEAACTKDLINITDYDFKVVTILSIVFVFVIIAITLKSITLPIILVGIIELAIFINLGLTYYTHTEMAFIVPICISTIQLGSSVDYAILLTTRYKKERYDGLDKKEAMVNALKVSVPSIITSAFGMFAATVGVAIYSDVSVIGTMCNLLARGAITSMLCVIIFLPALLLVLDKVICKTSIGFINKNLEVNYEK